METNPAVTHDGPEAALRTSLAIVRGMKLLEDIKAESNATVEHHEAKRFDHLETLFHRIHRDLYHDWGSQSAELSAPGVIADASKRLAVRNALRGFVENGNGNGQNAEKLFDSNGMVIHHPPAELAGLLAKFYCKIRDIKPFEYGNEMTLNFFITALGQLPAFQEVYPNGIDLRRLSKEDQRALRGDSGINEVRTAFNHALDPSRTPALRNTPDGFSKWPKNVTYIAGIPFLSHVTEDGTPCLATVNGGLVRTSDVKEMMEAHFAQDGLLSTLPTIPPSKIIGYLPDTEALRTPEKTAIDGMKIGEDGSAPLFCLDVNILTGLRPTTHDQLKNLMEQVEGRPTPITSLNNHNSLNNHGAVLRDKLLSAVKGDARMEQVIATAYEHINAIVPTLDAARDDILKKAKPQTSPKFFMSMGGAGAGKTAVEEIVKATCGDNFVVASLDQFRERSDLYKVLKAANHHADDYTVIEPFANSLRDWVTAGAREQKKNLLFDGTGIVYQPRYGKIVQSFKKEGYDTQVIGVDTMLVAPPGRSAEFTFPAVKRIEGRFKSDKRALPWLVVSGKHSRMPESVLQALEDRNLDKFSVFSNDGKKGQHYLVAESFDLPNEQLAPLQKAKADGTLHQLFSQQLMKEHPASTLKQLDGSIAEDGSTPNVTDMLKRNTQFGEGNVTFVAYPRADSIRLLAVYDMQRFTDLMEKAQMNAQASDPKLLYSTAPRSMSFRA